MDAKALAKSKRAHSQHHSKKSHSNQKQKAPSNGTNEAGNAKKPLGKQVRDGNLSSQGAPKLPSNWDRYGEESYAGSEETSSETAAPLPDVILPKSKGADYRHLIAEARSEMQSCTYMDVFPSLDDVLPRELCSGGSATLAVRGEGILSWIEDNSFIVDEKTTANPEASFLSLNLHILAEQLQKLDLAERLFIEEDMLPSELRADGNVASDHQSSQMQTSDGHEGTRNIEISSVTEFYEKREGVQESMKTSSSGCFESIHQDPIFNPSSISSNQVNNDVLPIELEKSSQTKAPKYTEHAKSMIQNANKKTSTFEATTEEAELDMLLASFSNTIDLDDSAAASSLSRIDEVSAAASSLSRIDEVSEVPSHLPSKGPNPAKKAPIGAELDDALDDLLQDTSYLTSHKEKSVQSHTQSHSPHFGTNSIANDDFDSWLDTI